MKQEEIREWLISMGETAKTMTFQDWLPSLVAILIYGFFGYMLYNQCP